MALDTNIALGVKPVEQPNMLAQMGQMMQMRQMQQGYESENALRDFYAQGGDLSTAEGRRQLMSKVGLKGAEIIDRQSQTRSRDVGTAEKSLELAKSSYSNASYSKPGPVSRSPALGSPAKTYAGCSPTSFGKCPEFELGSNPCFLFRYTPQPYPPVIRQSPLLFLLGQSPNHQFLSPHP